MSLSNAILNLERARARLTRALEHQTAGDDKAASMCFEEVRSAILRAENQIDVAIGRK